MQITDQHAYTITDISKIFGFHEDTVHYWARIGELRVTHDQNRDAWVVASDDLLAFLRVNGEAVPESFDRPH